MKKERKQPRKNQSSLEKILYIKHIIIKNNG